MKLNDIVNSKIYKPNIKYNSRHYNENGFSIFYTEAKITPKKEGYFVTFYKRINNKNEPFNNSDHIDFLIIKLNNDQYLLFNKKDLIDLKIISKDNVVGKMGFRVYDKKPHNKNANIFFNLIFNKIIMVEDINNILMQI
jgi:hypothetical protein